MLLAVDTSTQWTALAVYDGSQILGETIWRTHYHHTVELATGIEQLLAKCLLLPDDLRALAVAIGPGSFTSLRIGLAVVKGMALALHLPVVGIPTLDIVAASQPVQDLPLLALLQAGRGRVAASWYKPHDDSWAQAGEPELIRTEDLAKHIQKPSLVSGELTEDVRHALKVCGHKAILSSPARSIRCPSFLAEMGWLRWKAGDVDNVSTLTPIYLKVEKEIPG